MERIYTALYENLKAGRPAVLLTVVERKGSTPRGIGSHQVVFVDGTTMGTVGGGYQEHLAIECGKACLAEKRSDFRRLIFIPMTWKTSMRLRRRIDGILPVLRPGFAEGP